jgi:hypothetical protein
MDINASTAEDSTIHVHKSYSLSANCVRTASSQVTSLTPGFKNTTSRRTSGIPICYHLVTRLIRPTDSQQVVVATNKLLTTNSKLVMGACNSLAGTTFNDSVTVIYVQCILFFTFIAFVLLLFRMNP